MGVLNEIHFTSFNGIVIDNDTVIDQEVNLGKIYINGKGVFTDDVDVETFSVAGEARVKGLLCCDELLVEGTCYCENSLIAEHVTVPGLLEVAGKISSDDIIVSGEVLTKNDVKTALIEINGILNCERSISCETAKIHGNINVKANVNAIDLMFETAYTSNIAKISTENIYVKKDILSLKLDIPEFILECSQLDCEHAYLENCKITTIFCDDIEVGSGCEIGEILYRKTIKIDPTSNVGKITTM